MTASENSKKAGIESRVTAIKIIARWLKTEDFPDRLISDEVQDHAFIMDIVFGTVRRWRTLDWVLTRFVKKNPSPAAKAGLLIGTYQLIYMKNMAEHAALYATVEAVKVLDRHSSGFVNAVLRNVQRERQEIANDIASAEIGIKESHPEYLVAKWIESFGTDETARICAVDNLPADTVIIPLPFNDDEKKKRLLTEMSCADIPVIAHKKDESAIVIGHGCNISQLPGFDNGHFVVQDAAPLAALRLLNPKPGECILDACAAPGGKTLQIAASVGNTGRVIAMDLHEDRLPRLRENVARAGFTDRISIITGDASSPDTVELLRDKHIDALLLDVPCSNTGVLRRRVDARWRFCKKRLAAICDTQFAILKNMAELRPSRIVYSTCSIEHEEDEDIIAKFLETNTDYRLKDSVKLLPDDSPRDGAYAALLVRADVCEL